MGCPSLSLSLSLSLRFATNCVPDADVKNTRE
jgi:hypothetical protein